MGLSNVVTPFHLGAASRAARSRKQHLAAARGAASANLLEERLRANSTGAEPSAEPVALMGTRSFITSDNEKKSALQAQTPPRCPLPQPTDASACGAACVVARNVFREDVHTS